MPSLLELLVDLHMQSDMVEKNMNIFIVIICENY